MNARERRDKLLGATASVRFVMTKLQEVLGSLEDALKEEEKRISKKRVTKP